MMSDIPFGNGTSFPLSLLLSFFIQLSNFGVGAVAADASETHEAQAAPLMREYRETIDFLNYGPAVPVTPLPKEPEPPEPRQLLKVWATAYCSHPAYTDNSPFITASGKHVAPEIIAANFLRFDTEVSFPDLIGFERKTFVVGDRMNPRYWHAVDIWFPTCNEAKHFGRKATTIAVY